MRKIWLTFAQATTIALGVLLVVQTLRPDLLPNRNMGGVLTINESRGRPPSKEEAPAAGKSTGSYSSAARKAMPSVVNVFTSKEVKLQHHPFMDDPLFRRFFGDQFDGETQRTSSLGSGVIVGSEGYILTNHHVIEAADEIEIALNDGRQARAKLVGADPESDLAVLKVDLKNLPAITFGRPDQASVGDVVLAIGNPFGVGQTVTQGIVSGLGRSHLGINTFENFIQTDAAINPGNSGGALVDANGNLIGVNTAIYSRSGGSMGIGFAIPVSLARQVMDQIIATGSVTRGWIGVEVQDITPELAESFKLPDSSKGVLIAGVVRGGPADRAGVKPGDILVEVEGKPVLDSSAMLNLVAEAQPGKVALLRVLRNSAALTVKLTVGKRPKPRPRRNEEDE
ncbi:MAG TPA: Do family serine endopeptidase [Burkholderiales bacterium]|nr:Do family serine endopeptidase [Burkholderiales bacterium]